MCYYKEKVNYYEEVGMAAVNRNKSSVKSKSQESEKVIFFPKEVQKYAEKLVVDLLGIEKEAEYHKKIMDFVPHSAQVKEKTKELIVDMERKIERGQQVIKAAFQAQDKQSPSPSRSPSSSKNADFAVWERIKKNLQEKGQNPEYLEHLVIQKKSLQETANIPWDFMDRAYQVGIQCIKENKYEDGLSVFMFLRFLCPSVFEYWAGEATCLQSLGKWEEAMNTYFVSLVFKPKNPLIFFQIANCCHQLQLLDNCNNALDLCIEYAGLEKNGAPLASLARQVKQAVAA